MIHQDEDIYLRKRTGNDIWKNLYEPLMIETPKEFTKNALLATVEWFDIFQNLSLTVKTRSRSMQHQLTHQKIFAKFWEIEVKRGQLKNDKSDVILVNNHQLNTYPTHRLIEKYLELQG